MDKKIIFLDIDGTLLSHSKGISPKSIEAIKKARKNGHLVFLNTGRAKSYSKPFLNLEVDGFVFGAGAHIEINKQTISNNTISQSDMSKMIELLKANPLILVFEGSEKSYYTNQALTFFDKIYTKREQENDEIAMKYHSGRDMFNDLDSYLNSPTPINKMTIYFKQATDYQFLSDFLANRYDFIMYDQAAEIIVKGINKLTGIQKVCQHLNLNIQNSIAFGDSYNDYEMIKGAGIGVAMGNSHPDILALADLVTEDVDHDGIYHGFKKLNLI